MHRQFTDDDRTNAVAALKAEFQTIAARKLQVYGKISARLERYSNGDENNSNRIEAIKQMFIISGVVNHSEMLFWVKRNERREKIFGDAQVSAADEEAIYNQAFLEARNDAIKSAKAPAVSASPKHVVQPFEHGGPIKNPSCPDRILGN